MLSRFAFVFLVSLPFCAARAADEPGYTVEEGKLEGSLYRIAQPRKWNNKLLLIAHGARQEKARCRPISR